VALSRPRPWGPATRWPSSAIEGAAPERPPLTRRSSTGVRAPGLAGAAVAHGCGPSGHLRTPALPARCRILSPGNGSALFGHRPEGLGLYPQLRAKFRPWAVAAMDLPGHRESAGSRR